MKLQANYHGAWKNISPFVEENSSLDALRKLVPDAPKLRIVDGTDVIWYWNQEEGWHRPSFYKGGDR